jgi:hypothetical protein
MNEFFYGTPPQDTQDFSQVLRGVGRSIQDIGRGVSYYPYDLVGAPVDLINMALTPVGLGSERPVLGSDYLRNIAQSLGLAQPSTGSGTETAARFASALINPAAGARAVGKVGSDINRLVSMIDETPPRGSVRIRDDVPPASIDDLVSQIEPQAATQGFNVVQPGDKVSGLTVRKDVPNMSSIAASFDDYEILSGVREVPRNAFDPEYLGSLSYEKLDKRTKDLAEQIKQSKEINPMIVGVDSKGAYIVEGGHRFDALMSQDTKSIPAVVVIDKSDPPVGLLEPQVMAPVASDLPPVPRESFVEGVPAGQELIVHHNISPEKLSRVQKVGGMPVPSIAVSNIENPLTGFGDISLIGNSSMATPSAKNPVFGFDAYTARAPRITYKFDSKSEQNLRKLFSDVSENVKTTGVYDLADDWNNRQFNDLMRAKFLKEKGELPDPADYKDKWDYSRDLGARVDANFGEYSEWMKGFEARLPEAGVNIKETIFKGFTPSGNRKYVEANLQNLVKEMKGGAGSENFNYGVGNLRAVATPRFKKLNDVKAARTKIVSKEEFSETKNQVDKAYASLMDRIDELPNQDRYGYKAEDVLYEIGSTRNVNMIDTFKADVPEELRADIGIFMKQLKKLPTEYFEIKPQRAVQVSEFEGAIVPVDAPESSINYLRDQGIERIHFYSTPEERTELFKKFGDKMFGVGPAVGAGLLGAGMSQDEQMF